MGFIRMKKPASKETGSFKFMAAPTTFKPSGQGIEKTFNEKASSKLFFGIHEFNEVDYST